ncbi:MAG: hypothetical protein FVQ82_08780 [Planctomycetes bacterium]|nr:hypothetical protein [Planctomycetota bacterium]
MNSYNISDVQKLRILFEQAFSSCSDELTQADCDEYIALIAEGRADLLPAPIRTAVLDRISYDPDSAEILKDISAHAGSVSTRRPKTYFKTISISWALAACLMFGIFAWRIADPAPSPEVMKRLEAFGGQGDNSYWPEVNKKRLANQITRCRWRDYALVGSVIATCLLSTAVLADRLKKPKS